MKKLYLLLFLFTAVFTNAQQMLNDYHVCDQGINGQSGSAVFDLTVKNAEILFISEPGNYDIAYFLTLAAAQSNTNAISTPESYINNWSPQQIFARATNTLTQQTNYFFFVLNVDPSPSINPASLTFCSTTELPLYNLNDALQQLVAGQVGLTVEFYDLENGLIDNPSTFVPTVFPIQVIAVLASGNCGTVETSLTLNTNTCVVTPCPEPNLLSVTNVVETAVMLHWNTPGTVSYYQVYLTPAGAPAPLENTAPTYWAQSNSFLASGLIPDMCYSFYVRSACNALGTVPNFSEWVGPYQFCTVPNCENNGECPDNLSLVAFVDTNINGVKDAGEVTFDMGMFNYELNNSGTVLHGYSNGGNPFRIFDSNAANSYDLSYSVNSELAAYFSSATNHNDIQIVSGNGTQTLYFPILQLQPFQDLTVHLVPSGSPRPGFSYVNYIKFSNKGLQTIPSGTVYFMNDNATTILGALPAATQTFANGLGFSFTDLAPQEERMIQVTLQVPTIPTVSLGQILTNTATIEPSLDDNFPADNSATLSQTIIGSYDPNDKTEAHGGKIALDTFTTDDYMTYTIQFENTGTASAEFIRVEDLLDARLDPSTVEMLNASHPYNMRRIGNKLIWNFYNINLPPTATNPTQSHGFIQFKIKPTAGYTIGTMIPNAADIYFDYNPAIVTDTFQTQFVETLGTPSFEASAFYMHPNPAKAFIHLGLKDTAESISAINIYDVVGKSVKTISNVQLNETSIDVSLFSKGMYFVEITTKNNLKITKKLIVD